MTYILLIMMMIFSMPAFAQKACTEMGCENGLFFRVDPAQGWKNGQYDIRLQLGLKQVVCRGELPLRSCTDGPTFTCDDESVTIGESGCALPQNAHGLSDIRIRDEPRNVTVTIKRNYKTILTRTVIPSYATLTPNGPGCGPVCRNASYDLFRAD